MAYTANTPVSASITAQNTFSDPFGGPAVFPGHYNISVSGTWVATVTLQRSFDAGATWQDVVTLTSNIEAWDLEPTPGALIRIGVKSGQFTSGTIAVALYPGGK